MSNSFDNIYSTQCITIPIVGDLNIVLKYSSDRVLPTHEKYFLEKHKHETCRFGMNLWHLDVVKIISIELAFFLKIKDSILQLNS